MKIADKVIWITGASSGIGEALAKECVKKGAKVIISARRKDELERVKGSCATDDQNKITILPLDLSESKTFELTAKAAVQAYGHIDILINNGGISQRSLVRETPIEVDRKIMEVNYFGSIGLTKALLPHFLERKTGHFVAITSLVGKFGTPYRSGYAGSKHAVHGFYEAMRAELYKEGITVSIICPGFIKTNVSVNALTKSGDKLNKMDDAQANGMLPEVCARKIIRAIEKKRNEAYVGGKEIYAVYLKRFLPGLFTRILRKAKVR